MLTLKNSLLILAMLVTSIGIAQQDSTQKTPTNEIKVNAFNLIVFKAVDLSYEYLLNENQSLGVGILFKINGVKPQDDYFRFEIDVNRNFSITPYYRRYFSKKNAKGFFMEGFTMYASGKEFYLKEVTSQNPIEEYTSKNYNKLRFGLGIGVKIVSRKNISIDINFGLGIDLSRIGYVSTDLVTRGGVSVGYRF